MADSERASKLVFPDAPDWWAKAYAAYWEASDMTAGFPRTLLDGTDKYWMAWTRLNQTLNRVKEALQDPVSDAVMVCLNDLTDSVLADFLDKQGEVEANRNKPKPQAPRKEEMLAIIEKHPEVLEEKSWAAKARAISEQSDKGIKFSAKYVQKVLQNT